MGVPALFRWLSKKYPKIVTSVQEEEPKSIPGPDGQPVELPIEMRNPNPNGEDFDCLYLDMNGIVHPCTHPEGKEAPSSEEEMMLEIFRYTDRVVNMVRPRKLLMMAIDGVAPRAKMNQQRSRRFRAAQEATEKREDKLKALEEWKAMGLPISDEAASLKEAWDSNNITPGTPFMDLLAASLRYWVSKKMLEDEGWKDLKVIISDASVPGEGEHKIMEFIRRQRSHDAHDPNTKHVIYGLDADLIMLSLATHEPYFKVLREDVFASDSKRGPPTCNKCQKEGHIAANCISKPLPPSEDETKKVEKKPFNAPSERKPFIFLDVSVLREYLEVELDVPGLPFNFDLERAIDDWVFLIFFVGNDFLPHLPSLEIREGAIDTLLKIWKEELPRSGGYLTKHGSVEMKSAQVIMEGLASHEDEIFRKRKELEERMESNQKRRKTEEENRQRRENGEMDDNAGDDKDGNTTVLGEGYVEVKVKNQTNGSSHSHFKEDNRSAAEILKAELKSKKKGKANGEEKSQNQVEETKEEEMKNGEEEEEAGEGEENQKTNGRKRKQSFDGDDDEAPSSKIPALDTNGDEDLETMAEEIIEDEEASVEGETEPEVISSDAVKTGRTVNPDGTVTYEDTVKLWEPGYRERYYRQKFGVELSDVEFRKKLVKSYVEGLCWVLAYYYQGCPSWQWFYPYHYSPFAADFTEIEDLEIKFTLGKPFRPFEQLMGVFPAASRFSIPEAFRNLMTDEDSAIIDYYPIDFQIDMNGKKMAWQGVALLPFIDQTRLLDALDAKYPDLSEDENRRNSFGKDAMFVSEESTVYDSLCKLYAKRKNQKDSFPLDSTLTGGISGFVRPDPDCIPGSSFPSPLGDKVKEIKDIPNPNSISVLYEFPEQLSPHRSVMLPGVKQPKKVLTEGDRDWTRRGGPDSRGRGGGRGGMRGSGRGHSYQGPGVINYHQGHNSMRFGNGPVNGSNQYGIPPHQTAGGAGGHYSGNYQGQRPAAAVNAYSNPNASSNPYAPQHHNQYQSAYGAGGAANAYSAPVPPQPQAHGSYGAYGGYGQNQNPYSSSNSYGGYGTSTTSSLPARPPTNPYQQPYRNSQSGYASSSNYGSSYPSNAGSGSYGGYGGYGSAPPPVNPYGYSPAPPPQRSTNQSYGGYGTSNPYGYGQAPSQPSSYGSAAATGLPARPRPLGYHNSNGDPTRASSRGRGRGRNY